MQIAVEEVESVLPKIASSRQRRNDEKKNLKNKKNTTDHTAVEDVRNMNEVCGMGTWFSCDGPPCKAGYLGRMGRLEECLAMSSEAKKTT